MAFMCQSRCGAQVALKYLCMPYTCICIWRKFIWLLCGLLSFSNHCLLVLKPNNTDFPITFGKYFHKLLLSEDCTVAHMHIYLHAMPIRSNNLPNEHCTIKSIVWFRHTSSLVKLNLQDSTKLVNSEEHDKLVMTWDDELVKFSLGGNNLPP